MIRLLAGMDFPGALDPDVQLQPAGFDLTVAEVSRFSGTGVLDFTNERRELPDLDGLNFDSGGHPITLGPGGYLVTYGEEISVPEDCAGLVLPRSSLMRCGAVLHSALWDPGYRGRGQGLLTVYNELRLHPRARVGQFILIRTEEAAGRLYSGQYQGENL